VHTLPARSKKPFCLLSGGSTAARGRDDTGAVKQPPKYELRDEKKRPRAGVMRLFSPRVLYSRLDDLKKLRSGAEQF
jgi:hypothetical protein